MAATAGSSVFDSNAGGYDSWFDRHSYLFSNELDALKKVLPSASRGIEIGTGTGRFAVALGITTGVEPSAAMAKIAMARGITVIHANAEALPFHNQSFDFALMVTTDCFLRNISKSFEEAYRVTKDHGRIIIGLIDKNSELGKRYEAQKSCNPWYQDAQFHSVDEITGLLQQAGFTRFEYWQTLCTGKEEKEEPQPGYGKGSFVVISAQKK